MTPLRKGPLAPAEDVALDPHPSLEGPVHHPVAVVEVIPPDPLRRAEVLQRPGLRVAKRGPLQVVLDDDGVEFGRQRARVPRGVGARGGGVGERAFGRSIARGGLDGGAGDLGLSPAAGVVVVRIEERPRKDGGPHVDALAAAVGHLPEGGSVVGPALRGGAAVVGHSRMETAGSRG